jgi:small-conductance mechanosensitive channel
MIPILEKAGVVVIVLFGLVYIVGSLGYDITVFVAGLGIMGLVIAFAAQDTLSNFFSGFHILLDRPFKEGDLLYLESGDYCKVNHIGMRSTKLYNIFDHDMIILPNNILARQKVVNMTEPDQNLRINVEVGVEYGSSLDKVEDILLEAARNQEGIIVDDPDREPSVYITGFGDSSINFILRAWVDDIMDHWIIASNTRKFIDRRFREEGIVIPFPQRTVWVREKKDV